jgi:hypothetical protein
MTDSRRNIAHYRWLSLYSIIIIFIIVVFVSVLLYFIWMHSVVGDNDQYHWQFHLYKSPTILYLCIIVLCTSAVLYKVSIPTTDIYIYISNNNVTRTTVIRLPVSCSRAVVLILGRYSFIWFYIKSLHEASKLVQTVFGMFKWIIILYITSNDGFSCLYFWQST